MAASVGLQSKELGRDSSLPLQDHHRSTTLRPGSAQSAQRGKDRLQCAQSNDKFGYASLRSEEVTGGTKMKGWISVHSRTNANFFSFDAKDHRLLSGWRRIED